MNEIKIVNKHHKLPPNPRRIYAGRGSPLGNLFKITDLWDRNHVIELYRKWLDRKVKDKDPTVITELTRIATLVLDGSGEPVELECFCAPRACHTEVIRDLITERIKQRTGK